MNTNIFDYFLINHINYFSQKSWLFDNIIRFLSNNHLLKGGFIITFIWWAWFNDNKSENRKQVIAILLSSTVAMIIARIMVFLLPFRNKPMHIEEINFILPFGMIPEWQKINVLSSFPSDHAVLFFCLSTGLLFISKRIGILTLLYTLLFIAMPRIYLGLHYPTDIIIGGILGTFFSLIGNTYFVKYKFMDLIINFSYSRPNYFYPIFFLLTFQIADMFNSIRSILSGFEIILH
jgi:undecaprenyl-diphosphatase